MGDVDLSSNNISYILNNLSDYSLTEEQVKKYHTISINGKNGYYWYNATFEINIKNIEVIERVIDSYTRSATTFNEYVAKIKTNLFRIIRQIEVEFKEIYNPVFKKIIPIHNQLYYDSYNSIPFKLEGLQNISNSPFIEDLLFQRMKSRFHLSNSEIYLAPRSHRYFKQETVLGNLFISEHIYPNLNVGMLDSIAPVRDLAGYFLKNMEITIDISIVSRLIRSIPSNNTWESKMLLNMLNQYKNLDNLEKHQKILTMEKIEVEIFTTLDENTDVELPSDELLPTLAATDVDIISPITEHCSFSITSETILKVFSMYEQFIKPNNTMLISYFKPICPIHIRYILNTFPYYKNREIQVDGNKIVSVERINILKKGEVCAKMIVKFTTLKKLVRFNGNYPMYRGVISQVHFNMDEIDQLQEMYYNMSNFHCAALLGEILNFNLNMKINSRGMYMMLSKLTTEQFQLLDTKATSCRMTTPKIRFVDYLANSFKFIPQSFDHILRMLDKLQSQNSFQTRIALAAKTNFNICTLLQVYAKMTDPSRKELLNLLLLFSNGPLIMKNIIYTKLPKYTNDNTLRSTTGEESVKVFQCINYDEIIPFDIDKNTVLTRGNFNIIDDYMQHIKTYKNYEMYINLDHVIKKQM
ncbi:KN57gp_087 [Dikerogammarus haemobaphes nudivirus]|nr:KN57gp_087 [Dikerogammarus haemobaphes nudivirus]